MLVSAASEGWGRLNDFKKISRKGAMTGRKIKTTAKRDF